MLNFKGIKHSVFISLVSSSSLIPLFTYADSAVSIDPITPCEDFQREESDPGTRCRTSLGHIFETQLDPDFGWSILDPEGSVWSMMLAGRAVFQNQGPIENGQVFSNDSSTPSGMCQKIKGRLPTKKRFEMLLSHFEMKMDSAELSPVGIKEFRSVYPDWEYWIWSRSVQPDNPLFAFGLQMLKGTFYNFHRNQDFGGVVCVK